MTDTFQELIADSPQTPPAAAPETKTATATAEPVKAAPSELDAAVKAAQAVVAPEAVEASQLATSEAEKSLRLLADMGITPITAPNLLQTAQNAQRLVDLLKSDSQGFVAEIRRYDPQLADNLLEGATDEYLRIHPPDQQTSSQSRGAESYDPRISQLQAELAELKAKDAARTEAEREKVRAEATALVGKEYARLQKAMLDKLPETMSSKDRRFVELEMNASIGSNKKVLEHINTGNFLDLKDHFATAVGRLTAETMASAEKTKQEREAVVAGTIRDVPSAAQSVTGSERVAADPWDDESLALETKKIMAQVNSFRRG